MARNALRKIINETTNLHNSHRILNPLIYASQGLRYRKVEIILTTDIEKLGKAGEVVKVAAGHFRNHLMPKLLAVPNIDKFAYLIKEQHKIFPPEEGKEEVKVVQSSEADQMKDYAKAAKRLLNTRLNLRRKIDVAKFNARATKDEPIELESPVTVDVIVSEVARQLCVHIAPENVKVKAPFTIVGMYEVPLVFPKSLPLPEGKKSWVLNLNIRCK